MNKRFGVFIMLNIVLICGFAKALNDGNAVVDINILEDATIYSNLPDTNFNDSQRLRVGEEKDGIRRVYTKWDISSLPDSAVINSAVFYLNYIGGNNDPLIYLYESLSNGWTENTITWNNKPGYNSSVINIVDVGTSSQFYGFDVTDFVKNKGEDIFSIVLKTDESDPDDNTFKLFQEDIGYIELNISTNAPLISNVNMPSAIDEGGWLNITFDASDLDDNIDSVLIYKDGVVVSNNNSYEWHINHISAGSYDFELFVNDSTGLEDIEYRTLTVNEKQSIVINEFVSNPSSGDEWIELYNPTDSDINVTDCIIIDGIGYQLLLGGIVASGLTGVLDIPFAYLDNGGDRIRLKCDDITLDVISYGDLSDGNISDNAPAPQSGYSVGRWDDGYDTDIDKNDFMIFLNPTKNYINNDHTAPVISNVRNGTVDDDSATILWSTDENANSTVYYGKTTSLGERVVNGGYAASHSIGLSSLDAGSKYYYKVESCDETRNCANSTIYDFTTSSVQCHDSDTNCNGCVEMMELFNYITEWKLGNVGMMDLFDAITLWKSGVGC